MTILQGDIKFLAAKKMTETADGGGPPSGTVIGDTVSNAIFGDVSEQMRAGGKVNIKSIFAAVQSMDTDQYLGAHVIVSKPPQDPLISITLAKAATFDKRSDIVPRLEAYLNAGPEWAGVLYGNHIAGQRSIQIFARPGVDGPTVGRTLVLQYRYGYSDAVEQYVRVTRVSAETRTFTTSASGTPVDYDGQVFTVDISDPLRSDFPGSAANRYFTRDANMTLIRDTVVADAAEYCGAAALSSAVAVGDVSAQVASVYSQLVPNSRTETPVTDKRPASDSVITLATAPRRVDVSGSPFSQRIRIGQENRGYSYVTILRPLPAPGTVRATFRALGRNYTVADDGAGHLTGAGAGTINYLTGQVAITLDALPDDRSALVFYWGEVVRYTNRAGNTQYRPPEYTFDLEHAGITPGSFSVSWPSGGVTRTATANASGAVSGDALGEVAHVGGRVSLRPLYMIDPGGEFSIAYTWSDVHEEVFTGLSADAAGAVTVTLTDTPAAGSLEVHWMTSREMSETSGSSSTAGSTTKSSDNGTQVSHVDTTRTIPAYTYVVAYAQGYGTSNIYDTVPEQVVTDRKTLYATYAKDASSSATYSTASAQTSKRGVAVEHIVTDDGAGKFFGTLGTVSYGAKSLTLKVVADWSETSFESNYEQAGAFDSLNATGEPTATAGGTAPTVTQGGGGTSTGKGGSYGTTSSKEVFASSGLTVRYKVGSATPTAATQSYIPPGVVLDLCPRFQDYIVPGSISFTWMGHTYSDADGLLYSGRTDVLPGLLCGMIDYRSGLALMFDYTVGTSPQTITLNSLWTTRRAPTIANIVFSLPSSPSKPGSLIFSVTDVNGTQIIATSDLSGNISGSHTHGKVDFESGLAEIQFGDYVLDSSLTAAQKAEWWYSADDVRIADGKIWRPWPVDPSTLRYAVVGYSYLPLQADILGMDPVRLPPDGRVPIFRVGGYVVIGHTGAIGPITVSNGQTIDCTRVRLSRIRIVGADGMPINTGYTANLDAGTLHFDSVAGYAQPVTIYHRIEDLLVLSDVQIGGALSFTRAVTHDYPAGAYVSSALMFGDLSAAVTDVWDQQSWTGVWSDAQIGSAATGTYNDTLAPIFVTNADAVPERWAVVFTNTTSYYLMGEHVGVIATGSISADLAPINPATDRPYFTLLAIGWGAGWAAGNVLRFNTDAPLRKVVPIRTTQPGPEPSFSDHDFELMIRGDVDRP